MMGSEDLATAIMALDWKPRSEMTVEEQATRHGELQEIIAAHGQKWLKRSLTIDDQRALERALAISTEVCYEIQGFEIDDPFPLHGPMPKSFLLKRP